jgi:peptidoglycan/LPS O-acetylase OafA/YrhL
MTIGAKLAHYKGIGPGFDATRIGLALSVLFIHCSLLGTGGPNAAAQPLFPYAPVARWAFDAVPLPMFFALSGFLVAASAERLPLGQFLINRALRILPALSVEIILSALVLGPLLTHYSIAAYVSDPRFASYFLNIIGNIHYELPGLFLNNPEPGIVNGSLWTVPHEISCYFILTACIVAGLFRHRRLMLLATLALFGVSIAVFLCDRFGIAFPHHQQLVYVFVTRGAARLVPLFLTGILFYQYRDKLPCRLSIVVAAIIGYIGLCMFGRPDWAENPIFCFLTAPAFAYVVVYAGLSPSLVFKPLASGDYSYGIYLYGFPLQQAMIQLMPWLKNTAVFFVLSAIAATLVAAFSWHMIEKPVLRLRRRFSLTAQIHIKATPVSESKLATPDTAAQPAE